MANKVTKVLATAEKRAVDLLYRNMVNKSRLFINGVATGPGKSL